MSAWRKIARSPHFSEVLGLLLLASGALLLVSLLTYHATDPAWGWVSKPGRPTNWIGPVGAFVSATSFQVLGLSAWVLPLALLLLAWALIAKRALRPSLTRAAGLLAILLAFAMLLATLFPRPIPLRGGLVAPGGLIGTLLGDLARRQVGSFGTVVVALVGISLGLILSTRITFAAAGAAAGKPMRRLGQALTVRWARFKEARRRESMRRAVLKKHAREQHRREKEARRQEREAAKGAAADPEAGGGRTKRRAVVVPVSGAAAASSAASESVAGSPRASAGPAGEAPGRGSTETQPGSPPPPVAAPKEKQQKLPLPEVKPAGFRVPPVEMLTPPPAESPVNEQDLIQRARLITDKLHEFSVEGQVVQIHPGPVVTTYEFKPEAGVKYSRILSLVDDLCLAMKAESIRVDRIPGKSTVGIEVPNRLKETIHLRDVIGGTAFAASRSLLTLALGKTIDGEPFVADLERMPHLLIAGSTGSGKSVGLNCMVTSILYKATPEEVRFIMIDPKMLELGVYEDIPHLLIPVVTDMKKAAVALKWAVREMETRYRTLATTGVRNIEQFNTLLRREPGRTRRNEKTGAEEILSPLPYIVVVIDELADLMMVASVDVEESITRLAQMARAVGIHLVIATQRPSVDVITGIIKANFPARIGFRVSQRVDSRTILDTGGAEALLGMGDMLFLPPGTSRLIRVHGALVTEAETARIVEFLRRQSKPSYNDAVLKEPEEERESVDAVRDEMYDQAVRLVVATGQASISHLQRRLRLGYARAARIVDMMEDEGVVGPGEGAKPREVLVGPEFLERLDQIAEERP